MCSYHHNAASETSEEMPINRMMLKKNTDIAMTPNVWDGRPVDFIGRLKKDGRGLFCKKHNVFAALFQQGLPVFPVRKKQLVSIRILLRMNIV